MNIKLQRAALRKAKGRIPQNQKIKAINVLTTMRKLYSKSSNNLQYYYFDKHLQFEIPQAYVRFRQANPKDLSLNRHFKEGTLSSNLPGTKRDKASFSKRNLF